MWLNCRSPGHPLSAWSNRPPFVFFCLLSPFPHRRSPHPTSTFSFRPRFRLRLRICQASSFLFVRRSAGAFSGQWRFCHRLTLTSQLRDVLRPWLSWLAERVITRGLCPSPAFLLAVRLRRCWPLLCFSLSRSNAWQGAEKEWDSFTLPLSLSGCPESGHHPLSLQDDACRLPR